MSRLSCIFLPGFMCDGRLFSAQTQALEAQGYACLHGDLTARASIAGIAQDLLEKAPEKFAAIGLSMGGIVALELYRQAPHRLTHIALLNTTYHADRIADRRAAQLDRVRRGELDLVLRDELKPIYMHPDNRSADRLERLAQMAEDLGEDVFERQTQALISRQSYASILPSIACPTLVLTGEDDSICPPDLHREMAKAIPGARLNLVPQCGHLSSLERPDTVSAALLELLARDTHLQSQDALNPAS